MDTEQKLNILAESSKFDLACACKTSSEQSRIRGDYGRWIYPAALPSGQKVFLLKTLQSNSCANDCTYCPFNKHHDARRCSLDPQELAAMFIELLNANLVSGLFLSSGVVGTPDATMQRMLDTVQIVRRKYQFRGFIHLKIIPGAADAAIEQAVHLATRVSVNIEAPTPAHLAKLSSAKKFYEHIIHAMSVVNRARAGLRRGCQQTTQFVVGAAGEADRDIVLATHKLYKQLQMERVYFSAYQHFDRLEPPVPAGLFSELPPTAGRRRDATFIREHRLYQVDFLFRKYGFQRDDIYFDKTGNLSLETDPKTLWALKHPECFPVDPNRAERALLLRVPGIGPLSANRILQARRQGRLDSLDDLRRLNIPTKNAAPFLKLACRRRRVLEPALF